MINKKTIIVVGITMSLILLSGSAIAVSQFDLWKENYYTEDEPCFIPNLYKPYSVGWRFINAVNIATYNSAINK